MDLESLALIYPEKPFPFALGLHGAKLWDVTRGSTSIQDDVGAKAATDSEIFNLDLPRKTVLPIVKHNIYLHGP